MSAQPKTIKLAIIGTGLIVKDRHLPAIMAQQDHFNISALCNRTATKATALKAQFNLDASCYSDCKTLLEEADFDVALVCLPIAEVAQVVKLLLTHQKGVICEKPIADDFNEANRLVRLASQHKRNHKPIPYFVLENHRLRRLYQQISKLLAQGKVGTPHLFHLNDLHYTRSDSKWLSTTWRRQGDHNGGYIYDGGVHLIAAMRMVFPQQVATLSALFTHYHAADSEPGLLIQLSLTGGLTGQLALGDQYQDPDGRRLKIYGNKATLIVTPEQIEIWPNDDAGQKECFPKEPIGSETPDMWRLIYHTLTSYDEPPDNHPLMARQGLNDLKILEASIASAQQQGKQILLNDYKGLNDDS